MESSSSGSVNAETVNAFKNAYDRNYKTIWTTEASELAGPSSHKYKYEYLVNCENSSDRFAGNIDSIKS